MFKLLANRLFGARKGESDTVIIKVRVNGNYTFFYPYKARAGMKIREMNADEFQVYLDAR